MTKCILSEFNYNRCTNPVMLEIMRDIPIVVEGLISDVFYPHRAILCDGDRKKQTWKIKGIWDNKKTDTVIMGSGNFINCYDGGNLFSCYFSEEQNDFYKHKIKLIADILPPKYKYKYGIRYVITGLPQITKPDRYTQRKQYVYNKYVLVYDTLILYLPDVLIMLIFKVIGWDKIKIKKLNLCECKYSKENIE
jgi:hypothetical protein